MATKARQQYFADEDSLQKIRREFSIADDIQQKIDSIEPGAQVNKIETVKVNGTALVPDANKAVNVEVPEVIDNLYTVDSDNALSAKQGKLLYDYIQNIASRGRFLSNWNSATGLPMTNPSESPYPYKSGDYFVVSNVATSGGTNYRPDGSLYIIGQASTVVETDSVDVSDFYFYDGTNWLLLSNSGRQIAIDTSLSTTSTNPVENRVITNALNNKQDILTAGNHIDITNNVISAEGFQEELTAGENITIGDICHPNTQGPAPDGFHLPIDELKNVLNILTNTFSNCGFSSKMEVPENILKMPRGGRIRDDNGGIDGRGNAYYYWYSKTGYYTSYGGAFYATGDGFYDWHSNGGYATANGFPIRAFKDMPVQPDNTWTVIYDGSAIATGAGVFYNAIDGLISISGDGTTRYTMMDKNLGATQVYNYGDTLNDSNCGLYYQWGNNHGFPSDLTGVTTSTTLVDVAGYGPGNYYDSDVFIISTQNPWSWFNGTYENLWGGTAPSGTWCELAISAVDTTYTAGTGINIDANNVISNTQTSAEWGNITGTLSNQTDLQTALDAKQDDMVILKYGISTWNDFITAYNKNGVVYCRASSNSNPASGSQTRLAFMAYVNNETTPTEVEFQYYRSRSSHSTAATALDEVYVYKLVPSSGGTWTVTQRDTAAKPLAGTGIGLTYNASGMTISADTTVLATKTDLNSKQDTLVSGTNIKTVNGNSLLGSGDITLNDVKISAAAPSNPTEGMVWYDSTNDQLKVYDGTNWNVTGKEYNAGEGIEIGAIQDYSAMRGPCPEGFHVPLVTEWVGLKTIMTSLSLTTGDSWRINLHMPFAGARNYSSGAVYDQGNYAYYWSSSLHDDSYPEYSKLLYFGSGYVNPVYYYYRAYGLPVRSFKDSYVTPDSTWIVVQGTLGSAGIFWNQSEGLISITDGSRGYTIMDKNLGATTVWNSGDTLSEANCGKYYQRGNNYGFPRTGSVTTSNTQVDASGYGPGNYYNSSTFITRSSSPKDWSSVHNDNLWGGVTGIVTLDNAITNTGVLSVNGQTGNVTIEAFQLAPNSPLTPKYRRYGTQAQYEALTQYYTDEPGDTVYFTI